MNTKIIFFFFTILICHITNAQIIFHKTIGGHGNNKANCVKQTQDGGYIIVGSTDMHDTTGLDVYVVKTDQFGDTLWTRTYGGINDDIGNAVIQNPNGSYVIVGSTFSFGSGQQDIYVISINGNGDTLWTRTYGGISLETGSDIKRTSTGDYVIVGTTNSYGSGDADIYLIKINNLGDTLWTRTFGGTSDESGSSVYLTGGGGYVITGSTYSFGAGGYDMYIVTTNDSGNIVGNTYTYGGPNGNEYGNCGLQTSDGGYIFCGSTTSFGNGLDDVYVVKTDVSGTIQYQKTFGGASYDQGNALLQTIDGGYIIAGTSQSFGSGNSYVYLLKTDATLTLNWSWIIGGTSANQGNSVAQTTDGGYIVAGSTQSFGQGGWDIYLIKTDANGFSDCNYFPATNLSTIPSTQITHALTIVSTGGIITKDSTIVSFGGKDSTICFEWEGIPEIPISSGESFIYPNPSNGTTHLLIHETNLLNEQISIRLYDVLGKELNIEYLKENSAEDSIQMIIETRGIPKGVYFIRTTIGQRIFNNIITIY